MGNAPQCGEPLPVLAQTGNARSMLSAPHSPSDPPPLMSWPVILLIALIVLPELVLIIADAGWIGTRRWRAQAYTYGAFWAGILGDWTPNYTAQPFAMFFSYSFLHAGAGHLFGNVVALAWLGQIAHERLTPKRLFGLYAGATLGGALAYAALSTSFVPMVGASGAIFGLAGAWLVWAWQDQPDSAHAWRFAGQMTFLVILLNAAIWYLQDGNLAWETHLGGFAVGAALAAVLPRRS